jgi:lipopolysaccharide heptosyltransferase II
MARWSEARNILCVRLDTLGDILMTTPAIRALKESSPDARVTLLTSASGAAVAPLIPEIDDTIVFAAPWMKATDPRSDPSPDFQMIRLLQEQAFDAAVIFTVFSQNPLPAAYLCYLAGIPLRLAHCRENPYQLLTDWVKDPDPDNGIRHEVRRHLDLVATQGFRPSHERLSLSIAERARDRVQNLLGEAGISMDRPIVAVHPGATAPSRRYPPEKFAAAARRLAVEDGAQIVLTGSAGESDVIEAVKMAIGRPCLDLSGRLNLESLAALIEAASVLLVNNTGPAHMAAALGTPVVDLYALTNPQHTPWQAKSRVLSHDVPCRNCFKSVCPFGHNDCLRLVSPDDVVRAARELLSSAPPRRIPCTRSA